MALTTNHQLEPRLKKEYSYTCTPPLGLHGLFWYELFTFHLYQPALFQFTMTYDCSLSAVHEHKRWQTWHARTLLMWQQTHHDMSRVHNELKVHFHGAESFLRSWDLIRFSATQEIPHLLCNPKFHFRIHNSPPSIPILSQINPVHASTPLLRDLC